MFMNSIRSRLFDLASRDRVKKFVQKSNVRIHTNIDWPRIIKFIERGRPVDTGHRLIRMGGEFDGGYLVADDFDSIKAYFSPGVSVIADFELDLANRDIPCFMIDYSVDAPPVAHPLFHFQKKFLGNETKAEFISLPDWMAECAPPSGDLVLQMDIEGAEIPVILGTPSVLLRRFRQIIIEFHWLEHLLDPAGLYIFEQMFDKLLNDFDVVHIHPNNCLGSVEINGIRIPQFVEYTFLRKDRAKYRKPIDGRYPHHLDRRNIPEYDDEVLHPVWYRADWHR